ncbi:MAG TPA: ABC transporter permease [Candidatus Limnocylindrales bacterium]|nr:ABC transporter permease [Candidatus Limnocylindrales bacterium]
MNAFIQHFAFEFRTGIRNRQLLLMNYLFPLGFYMMMGLVMTEINPLFRDLLLPAMVVFSIMTATLLGIPDPLVNARENGIFRSYKINGVPSSSILIIPTLTTIIHLVIVASLITVTAFLFFGVPLPVVWLNFVLVFVVMAFSCAGLSVLIGVVSPSSRMTILWSQLVFIPSMILGGMMFPYSMLPAVAGKFAQLLPATQAMNAFNGIAMGSAPDFSPWGSVIILSVSGVLAFGVAAYLFRWDSHNTTRHGNPLLALLPLLPYIAGIFLP